MSGLQQRTRPRRPLLPPPPTSPVLLPHLIQPDEHAASESVPEAEDIFGSSLMLIDPFAANIMHGEPGAAVWYNVRDHPPLLLQSSDPQVTAEQWLFAHYVWNSAVLLAECLSQGWWWIRLSAGARTRTMDWSVRDMAVLELGAGTGLVGLAAAQRGPQRVAITDFPASSILQTLRQNVQANVSDTQNVVVHGHEWGCLENAFASEHRSQFERVLAADTLWLDGAHAALAASIAWFLKDTAEARAWIVAGFSTGRSKVRLFLEEVLPTASLAVLEAWEVDIAGNERQWEGTRQEGPGEGARWCVIAVVGWTSDVIGTSHSTRIS